jgi:hypothetical protein
MAELLEDPQIEERLGALEGRRRDGDAIVHESTDGTRCG